MNTTASLQPVRVAIVGTGNAARNHAKRFQAIPGCAVVAGVDSQVGKAEAFCSTFDIPNAYQNVDDMLKNVECDAVSVVTSDAYHESVAIAALQAKKHVLCEKPLSTNYQRARRMVEAARQAGTINMINFSYRSWPALDHIADIVKSGSLGELRHVEASYYQSWLSGDEWKTNPAFLWRLSSEHGGTGVLGDVGVHILDFATYPIGELAEVFCSLKTFPKGASNRVGEYKLDANDSAVINVEFKNGAFGVIQTTRWATGHSNRLFMKICGSLGSIEFDSDVSSESIRLYNSENNGRSQWETVDSPPVKPIHQRFIDAIRSNTQGQPDFERGAAVQKALDACFNSAETQDPVLL